MGWFDDIKEKFAAAQSAVETKFAQWNNSAFKDAACGMMALVTAADGVVDPAEKQKTAGAIERHNMLKVFNAKELRTLYSNHLDDFEFDYEVGLANVKKALLTITDPEQQDGLIRLGIMIGGSDGDFDETEQAAIRTVCGWWGVTPSKYSL
jgi:tellurite resistance protein TerB